MYYCLQLEYTCHILKVDHLTVILIINFGCVGLTVVHPLEYVGSHATQVQVFH